MTLRVILLAGLLLCGCERNQDAARGRAEPVIFGSDDRQQWYEVEREDQRTRIRDSVAVLVPDLSPPTAGYVRTYALADSLDVAEFYGVCDDERFAHEPAAAQCSATLIDDNLLLTAGHCFGDGLTCERSAFVFDYLYTASGELPAFNAPGNVYFCKQIVSMNAPGRFELGDVPDYAFVQLHRRPTDDGRAVAPLTTLTSIANGMQLYVAGAPLGTPIKYTLGPVQRTAAHHYFQTSHDILGGNSGSGLFTTYGALVAVLSYATPGDDFVDDDGCNRYMSGTNPYWYVGSFDAREAARLLCDSGWPSRRLCGTTTPYCGDYDCGEGEDHDSCPEDCSIVVPSGWTCDASYYGAFDGCDCECGIVDPDCSVSGQELYNCAGGQRCGASAHCESSTTTPDGGLAQMDASVAPADASSDTASDATIIRRPDAATRPEPDASVVVHAPHDENCATHAGSRGAHAGFGAMISALLALALRRNAARARRS